MCASYSNNNNGELMGSVGDRIQEAIKAAGASQEAVARALTARNVPGAKSKQTVSNWIAKAKANDDLEKAKLIAIAQVLREDFGHDVTWRYLRDGTTGAAKQYYDERIVEQIIEHAPAICDEFGVYIPNEKWAWILTRLPPRMEDQGGFDLEMLREEMWLAGIKK